MGNQYVTKADITAFNTQGECCLHGGNSGKDGIVMVIVVMIVIVVVMVPSLPLYILPSLPSSYLLSSVVTHHSDFGALYDIIVM